MKARSKEHLIYWTTHYPTVALITLAALVKKVVSLNFSEKVCPALFIISQDDKVVDAKKALQIEKNGEENHQYIWFIVVQMMIPIHM